MLLWRTAALECEEEKPLWQPLSMSLIWRGNAVWPSNNAAMKRTAVKRGFERNMCVNKHGWLNASAES